MRRWISEKRAKDGFFLSLGPDSFNTEKEEPYSDDAIVWGIGLHTTEESVYYSEPRIKRLARKVMSAEFSRGNKRLLLASVQSLHGSVRNMAGVLRAFRAHHKAISRLLATADPE